MSEIEVYEYMEGENLQTSGRSGGALTLLECPEGGPYPQKDDVIVCYDESGGWANYRVRERHIMWMKYEREAQDQAFGKKFWVFVTRIKG